MSQTTTTRVLPTLIVDSIREFLNRTWDHPPLEIQDDSVLRWATDNQNFTHVIPHLLSNLFENIDTAIQLAGGFGRNWCLLEQTTTCSRCENNLSLTNWKPCTCMKILCLNCYECSDCDFTNRYDSMLLYPLS